MTRELVIRTWCDMCPPEDPQRAMTHRLALDGPPLEIDLCELHEVALNLVDIGKALAEHGRQPERSEPAQPRIRKAAAGNRLGRRPVGERTLLCPFCPVLYATPYALVSHMTRHHGLRAPDGRQTNSYGALFPTCPLCGKTTGGHVNAHCQSAHGGSIGQVWREALAKPARRAALHEIERSLTDVQREP